MIVVTGDTHGGIDIAKLGMREFPQQKEMTKNDYVIVCGDFGFVFDYRGESSEEKYWLDWLENKNFTTLFVVGNHECFPRLYNDYPRENWCGGEVIKVRPSVMCLMTGDIFTIDGVKFFAFGGASSHDKETRVDRKSWWSEEIPSNETFERALKNLDANNWEVDFVITHCAPDAIQHLLADWYGHDKVTNFLETVRQDLDFQVWFCGHYHVDRVVNEQHVVLYDRRITVDPGN